MQNDGTGAPAPKRTDAETLKILQESKNEGDYNYKQNEEFMAKQGYKKNPAFKANETNAFIKSDQQQAPADPNAQQQQAPADPNAKPQAPADPNAANKPSATFGGKSANEVWQAALARNPNIANNPKWAVWAYKHGIDTGGTAKSPTGNTWMAPGMNGSRGGSYSAGGYGRGGRVYDDYAYTNQNRPGANAAPKNAADAENMAYDNRKSAFISQFGPENLKFMQGNHYKDDEGHDYIYDQKSNSWNAVEGQPSTVMSEAPGNYERKMHAYESASGADDKGNPLFDEDKANQDYYKMASAKGGYDAKAGQENIEKLKQQRQQLQQQLSSPGPSEEDKMKIASYEKAIEEAKQRGEGDNPKLVEYQKQMDALKAKNSIPESRRRALEKQEAQLQQQLAAAEEAHKTGTAEYDKGRAEFLAQQKADFAKHQKSEDARYAEYKTKSEAWDKQRDYLNKINNAQQSGPKNHKTQRFLNGAGNAVKDFWFGRGDYAWPSDERVKNVYKPSKEMLLGVKHGYY